VALLPELVELKSGVIFVLFWEEVVVDFVYQNLLHFVSFLASRVGKHVFEIDTIFSPIDEQTVLLGHRVGDAKEAELLIVLCVPCSVASEQKCH